MRVEAGTNLIGGQPFSVANLREVRKVRQFFRSCGTRAPRHAEWPAAGSPCRTSAGLHASPHAPLPQRKALSMHTQRTPPHHAAVKLPHLRCPASLDAGVRQVRLPADHGRLAAV